MTEADVCISRTAHRRYDWVQYKNEPKFGSGTSCSNRKPVKEQSYNNLTSYVGSNFNLV